MLTDHGPSRSFSAWSVATGAYRAAGSSTTEKTRTLPLPPIVGAITLIGGIVLLVTGRKKG